MITFHCFLFWILSLFTSQFMYCCLAQAQLTSSKSRKWLLKQNYEAAIKTRNTCSPLISSKFEYTQPVKLKLKKFILFRLGLQNHFLSNHSMIFPHCSSDVVSSLRFFILHEIELNGLNCWFDNWDQEFHYFWNDVCRKNKGGKITTFTSIQMWMRPFITVTQHQFRKHCATSSTQRIDKWIHIPTFELVLCSVDHLEILLGDWETKWRTMLLNNFYG